MQPADDQQALTQSIGEHAVTAIGAEHLAELRVILESRDMHCLVQVKLSDHTNEEQLRAIDKLLDVQLLFMGEVVMEFDFLAPEEESHATAGVVSQRQFSYA